MAAGLAGIFDSARIGSLHSPSRRGDLPPASRSWRAPVAGNPVPGRTSSAQRFSAPIPAPALGGCEPPPPQECEITPSVPYICKKIYPGSNYEKTRPRLRPESTPRRHRGSTAGPTCGRPRPRESQSGRREPTRNEHHLERTARDRNGSMRGCAGPRNPGRRRFRSDSERLGRHREVTRAIRRLRSRRERHDVLVDQRASSWRYAALEPAAQRLGKARPWLPRLQHRAC
jgi:hypothetical protein